MKTLKPAQGAVIFAIALVIIVGAVTAFASTNYESKIADQEVLQQGYHDTAQRLRGERDVLQKRITILDKEIQVQKDLHSAAKGRIEVYTEEMGLAK